MATTTVADNKVLKTETASMSLPEKMKDEIQTAAQTFKACKG